MDLTWMHIWILICSGLLVGFINTLAGGGTIISVSTFMFLGLPPIMANGTNRIPIIFQNIAAVYYFNKQKLIDWHRLIKMSIFVVIGGISGALLAGNISDRWFNYIFMIVIVLFGFSMLINPNRWMKEKVELQTRPLNVWYYVICYIIGIYSGFIHVGCGYLFMGVFVLLNGFELVKANAMKNAIVLFYVPFSLLIFALSGNVCWSAGLIHAIGNIIGASIAARFAVKRGGKYIRYIMLFLIIIVICQISGIITPETISQWFRTR